MPSASLPLIARLNPGSQSQLKSAITTLVELHGLAMQMSHTKDEMATIKVAVHGARLHLAIDRIAVFLKDGDHIRGTWGTDDFGNIIPERNFRRAIKDLSEHEMVERAFREQNYLTVMQDVPLRLANRTVGMGWNAMVALWYGDEPLGWIACDNLLSGAPLEPFQIEVLKLFASTLAQALVRGRAEAELRWLNRELEQHVATRTAELHAANAALFAANAELLTLSQSDGLTKIGNRRLFDEVLEREWARSTREGTSFAIALIDIDYFKQFNDACGHLEGDAALIQVATCLKQALLRPADLVARYGGEEFVLVLPNTDETGAVNISHRIQAALEDAQIAHPDSPISPLLTVSIGVAATEPTNGTISARELVDLTDKALYAAKQGGRNRVGKATLLRSAEN